MTGSGRRSVSLRSVFGCTFRDQGHALVGWVVGLVPIALGVRAILLARGSEPEHRRVVAVTGVLGVATLTVADGADNVGVYIPLFRQAGPSATVTYVVVFAVLVGVWCLAAHALTHRRALVELVERTGHWLVPVLYVAIGVRIIVVSNLFG